MSSTIERLGVVVCVDGSAPSKAAVDWAAGDAAARGAGLTVVHVASALGGIWPQTPAPVGLGDWQRRRGRQILDEAVSIAGAATREGGPVRVRSEIYYSATVPT